jgi:hypothetical protein
LRGRSELSARQTDSISTERQIPGNIPPVLSNLKIESELVSLAHQFTARHQRRPLRIAHLDSKLSAIPLCGSRKREDTHHTHKPN